MRVTLLVIAVVVAGLLPAWADDWQPVSPEELKMTGEPLAPGAPAIILYRQVDRNDKENHEINYVRIKVLTEAGRQNADVEIPFVKDRGDIGDIKARTIRPDGSIVKFEGKAFEKTIVKAKGVRYLAKTFTLSDVQVGSIIEYRYAKFWDRGWLYDSHWILNQDLFTKRARFTLRPWEGESYGLRWITQRLPAGSAQPKSDPQNTVRLEVQNVAAFQDEDYMPPQDEVKARVDFIYTDNDETNPEKFWKKEGKRLNGRVEDFVNKRKAMEQAVAEIVAASDSPEAKLRKIYARVQQVRNLAYERSKTAQEQKREKLKDINNIEDIWKRGYANDGEDLTWLFLGLARAAGFEASPVMVSPRHEYFFNPKALNSSQLATNVVLVKLNGKDLYLDPGAKFVPYGLLPWSETAVTGLRLDRDGGNWLATPLPPSSASRVVRKADLKLDDTGTLEGKLTVTYSGQQAVWRRQEERREDAAARKKFLEDEVKTWIPAAIELELKNQPDWDSAADTLVAEFDLKVPGWVASAGRRAVMAVGLFGGSEKHVFEHADRVQNVYFEFPWEELDDITIEPPLGWQVGTMPPVQNIDAPFCGYGMAVESKNGTLHLTRRFAMHGIWLEQQNYGTLRNFFQTVRSGDEMQIVLQPGH